MNMKIKMHNGRYVNILITKCEDQFDNIVDIVECDLLKQSEVGK